MSLIEIKNLTFAYDGGSENVFENLNLKLDTDWKLGLIGRNGRGKTTLLKLLAGEYPYQGSISAIVKFTRFPFPVKGGAVYEILEKICPAAQEWEILREFGHLEIKPETLYADYTKLSCGEQTKILLAALFADEGNFPLIDEPTNHLDAAARKTVSAFLKRKSGFILVSHDRAFLDGCIDHVLSINKTGIEIQSGNFSSWQENFIRRQTYETAQSERLKKDVNRLKQAAERTAVWADKTEASKYGKADSGLKKDKGYVGHKAAKMMKRAKVTSARRDEALEAKSRLLRDKETAEDLKMNVLEYRSPTLMEFSSASVFYGDRKICKPVTFRLEKGERIALDGGNGSGKSSLISVIRQGGLNCTGIIKIAGGLKISYVPQTCESVVGTVSDYARENGLNEAVFMAALDKTGFTQSDFGSELSYLSEGQKKKVLLAKSISESAHVYVWDEPLNYLDVYARIQIEKLILKYNPTMIFVEHDESFRNAVATKTVQLFKAD